MQLSARMMDDVSSVNNYSYTPSTELTQGNGSDVFFQLIDAAVNLATSGANPTGRRYCPSTAATLQVTFKSIDNSVTVCRFAALAWPTQDLSMWKITIFPTDNLVGTYTMFLRLTDGSSVLMGSVQMAVQIQGLQQSMC